MKTFLPILALVLALVFSSCRKDRSCACSAVETEVRTGSGEKTTVKYTSSTITTEYQKKGTFEATTECYSQVYSYPDSGGSGTSAWSSVTTVDSHCELK